MSWKKPVLLTASLTAQNTFSDPVRLAKGQYNFMLEGTFVATVNLYRSFDNPAIAANWEKIGDLNGNDFTSPAGFVGEEPEGAWFRFGIETGNFTSGTVTGRISR